MIITLIQCQLFKQECEWLQEKCTFGKINALCGAN